jgi:hypothetical protein
MVGFSRRQPRWRVGAFAVFAVAAVAATIVIGNQHDYFTPWVSERQMARGDRRDQELEFVDENSGYGSLLFLFTPRAAVYALLPEAPSTLAWLVTAAALVRLSAAEEPLASVTHLMLAYVALLTFESRYRSRRRLLAASVRVG